MSSRSILALVVLALLVWGPRARAELGTIDNAPAGTLLLPYFEVNLGNPIGMTTVFSIVNSGDFGTSPSSGPSAASAAIAHVTLWTDLGIPTFAFDIYLTGFDVCRSICAMSSTASCRHRPATVRT
jgi:hypothetical protein